MIALEELGGYLILGEYKKAVQDSVSAGKMQSKLVVSVIWRGYASRKGSQ